MGKEEIICLRKGDDFEIHARAGAKSGNPAVLVTWGYALPGSTGCQSFCGSFAVAELVQLDDDWGFERIAWGTEDAPNRQMIDWPKDYSSWSPQSDVDGIPWDDMRAWINRYVKETI